MKIASVAEVGSQFNAFVEASESGPIVVTREGKPVAVLVGIDDEDEVERLLMAYSPQLRAILDKSRQSIREGRGIPAAEFWKRRGVQEPQKRGKGKKKTPSRKGGGA
jgi:prevent-host-death family protein